MTRRVGVVARESSCAENQPVRPHGVWPWMVAATILVMVVPPAVVWALSALGVITTLWAGVAIAALLALAASSAGSAFWRRRATGDVLFSDLLLWGWLRRRRMETRTKSIPACRFTRSPCFSWALSR